MFKRKAFDNLVFGKRPVFELLKSDATIDKILIVRSAEKEFAGEIIEKAKEKSVPVQFVPVEKLNALTGGIHQGIIAFTAGIKFQNIEEILPFVIEKGQTPLVVVLDGVTDVKNFGAIARTAYGAGVHAIIIPSSGTSPVNSEAIKASAGALEHIAVCRESGLVSAIEFLKLNGLRIFGADARADKFIFENDLSDPCAIILGNEETGISGILRKYIDETVKLPMMNDFDSYNVSVAAGMMLYEVMKQRLGNW